MTSIGEQMDRYVTASRQRPCALTSRPPDGAGSLWRFTPSECPLDPHPAEIAAELQASLRRFRFALWPQEVGSRGDHGEGAGGDEGKTRAIFPGGLVVDGVG